MELDDTPTSRLDHLAELATSPTHANVHPPNSTSSNSSASSSSSAGRHMASQQQQQHSSGDHPHPHSHSHNNYSHHQHPVRSHGIHQHQLEPESWRSPITPTTTHKFKRMAIHEVLEGNNGSPHEGHHSPPYKRKGSPEESSFSDPVHSSRRPNTSAHPLSPRRQDSPMPVSNSDEDEDMDPASRNFKKRRMVPSSSHHPSSGTHTKTSPTSSSSASPGSHPGEVMDQVRTTLKLKQQQKAIIESRQTGAHPSSHSNSPPLAAVATSSSSQHPSHHHHQSTNSVTHSKPSSQPVTEKTPSGISVFHGSASFAARNGRALTSPKNPKNAKSLTIFAPSYSESSLSIHSAPLQPSQGHQIMSMNPRTSQPLHQQRHHQPHPFSQRGGGSVHGHQPPLSSHHQQHPPLRSPKTAGFGHAKKSSRAPRGGESSSGTLPAPILSSHTGPLPSPMYPHHPSTPFHHPSAAANTLNSHLGSSGMVGGGHGPLSTSSKHVFMDTVSNLFDSVESSKSLKYTLEEQIRKSAQLLQTLQSSGTMIESLVRGQFKELEKGVIEKFENELEHLGMRIQQLEDHQGLVAPARPSPSTASKKVNNVGGGTTNKAGSATSLSSSSATAMSGVSSTHTPVPVSAPSSANRSVDSSPNGSTPSSPPLSSASGAGTRATTTSADGTLPTPPFNKTQQEEESSMEVEEDEAEGEIKIQEPRKEALPEYHSSVKKLQERVASLEKRQPTVA